MKNFSFPTRVGAAATAVALACLAWNSFPRAYSKETKPDNTNAILSPVSQKQIAAIQNFKASLSPSQRKLPVALLLAKASSASVRSALPQFGSRGRLRSLQATHRVRVYGQMSDRIKTAIQREGQLTGFFPEYGVATAVLSTTAMEHIATATEITHIGIDPGRIIKKMPHARPAHMTPAQIAALTKAVRQQLCAGTVVTQGDKTHEADKVRTDSKVSGAGIKIGVISDNAASAQLSKLKGSGELPQDVQILTGQQGTGNSEGTAMMEIIHDLAPDAKLEFSTSGNSPEQMAKNIRALKADGCKIIVDDIGFLTESVYQEDVVSAAIREVSTGGALYLTAIGNDGNRDIGPTGSWDSTFKDATDLKVTFNDGTEINYVTNDWDGQKHNLNPVSSDTLVSVTWADPVGKSSTDYDVYIFDANGKIVDASIDTQDGNDNPVELTQAFAGERILVGRPTGSKVLPLRVFCPNAVLGASVGPTGYGHGVAEFALCVGASPAQDPGPAPNPFTADSKVEDFSSTGPRTLYFTATGDSQSRLIKKPDITAADHVSCATEDFEDFYGTSAAAPHAAAIAALAWSQDTSKSASDINKKMLAGTIDIMAGGYDYSSGYGIVMAPKVVTSTNPTPTPVPTVTPGPTPTTAPNPTATPLPTATPVPLPAGSIAFTSTTYSVKENAGTATISVQRNVVNGQGATGVVSVKYQTTTGGTATLNSDYKAVTGTLTWESGDSTVKKFTVPIVNDTIGEATETVKLRIYDLVGSGTIVASRQNATLSILDDDLDKTPPKVSITTPKDGASVSNVNTISGTVSDEGGSKVATVVLTIQRLTDGLYWNGTSWGKSAVQLATTLSGNTWTRSSGNPPSSSLSDGSLQITAIATDGIGNKATAVSRVFADTSAPFVFINSPANGSKFKTVTRVLGTVSDTGSDSKVVLYIQRVKDGKYYTGSTWGKSTPLAVQLEESGEWSYKLPGLDAGNYILTAVATDSVGNKGTTTSTFTITGSTTSTNAT